ncbi:MAG: hypothetical protein ACRC26_11430 [Bacteroidales bacterium]
MKEKNLNEKESIDLITRMIKNTQQNINAGGGNPFIIWGVSVLIAAFIVLILLHITKNVYMSFGWFIIPIIGYIWTNLQGYKPKVVTHIDRMLATVWKVSGAFCVVIPLTISIFMLSSLKFSLPYKIVWIFVPWIEIIIVSLGISVTGIIIASKPIKVAGALGIFLSFFTIAPFEHSASYTFIIWSIVCLIIPGIKLNRDIKKVLKC